MIKRLVNYIKSSRTELRKVIWPTKKQTRNHTLMVIGISIAVAIFLGAVDFVLNKVLEIFVY